MNKNYLIICLLVLFTFSSVQSQTKELPLTKKERRALKKESKKKVKTVTAPSVVAEKTGIPSIEEQVERIAKPQNRNIQENQDKIVEVKSPTEESITDISSQGKEVIVNKPNGAINWTQQYIEAVGQSVIDNDKFKNPAQAKLMATRGAVVVAQRNLLEIVKGVNIIGETTVQDMITTSDYIYSRVEGVVKGAKQIVVSIEKDGYIEVRLRMPIYGQESLANTMDDNILNQLKKKNGIVDANLSSETETGEGVDGSKPILFNVENGEKFDPSMFPIIVDDSGKVLFDFSKIYKLKDGKFPKYLQMGKDILQALGNQKGVDIINMIQTGKGQFQIPEKSSKRVFWQKLGNIAQNVGAALFKLIF